MNKILLSVYYKQIQKFTIDTKYLFGTNQIPDFISSELVGRVFGNGPGDLDLIPGRVILKT